MRLLTGVFLFSSFLGAQTFSFGVKGGGFLTEPAERVDQSKRYVGGPSAELKLPAHFALEGNALYSRFGSSRVRGNAWEFPVLGKYYFAEAAGSPRPYVSAGMSFRQIWLDSREFGNRNVRGLPNTDPAVGAVAAGGVALNIWKLKVAPEIRYTRWGGSNFPATNPNELQALVGIHF